MKINEDFAAVHAYLCADGYVIKNPERQKKKYYCIGFRNTHLILLKDFQERFERVFGVKPHLIEGQRCRIGSRKIYEMLTEKFGSFYSWEWRMPKLNQKLSRIWLRAYFDCEGWVTCKSHQNRMIGVDCVNELGIKQVQDTLKELGIESKVKKRNTRNIFSLFIFGKDNLIKFSEKVGFLSPLKMERLSNVLKDFVNYRWIFPEVESEKRLFVTNLIKERAKLKRDSWITRIISKEEKNLLKLNRELKNLFGVESKVSKRINGLGTVYYELNINKKEEVRKLINNDLFNQEEREKWLKLRN